MPVTTLTIRVDDEEYERLTKWKERYEQAVKRDVTWPDLLLAYANSKVTP